jgi:hypothetical protein
MILPNVTPRRWRQQDSPTKLYGIISQKTVRQKLKLSLRLICKALCHDDIQGSAGVAPYFFTPAPDGSGQLHALVVLPPGKEPPIPIQ